MILSVANGTVRVTLSPEERVIMYLAQDLPMPETSWDQRGKPRTVESIFHALKLPQPSTYKIMQRLESDKTVEVCGHLFIGDTNYRIQRGHDVWRLTGDGRLLAEAIRGRYLPEIPRSDAK